MIGDFTFFAPTKILFQKGCVLKNREMFTVLGRKALIVTYSIPGKHYALDDLKEAFDEVGIEYMADMSVEENPSTETVEALAKKGLNAGIDFVVGIGGGSPIDAAKAVGVMIKNPGMSSAELFDGKNRPSVPVVGIPTTSGTGAEVTHWSIITRNDIGTKQAISSKIFPVLAMVDPSYLMGMPVRLTRATAIDALCHNIESYVSAAGSFLSRQMCEISFRLFAECADAMKRDDYSYEIREKQMMISLIGGLVNTQTGSSLPHGMSYALTHHKHIPHGLACGLLISEYMGIFKVPENVEKVGRILELCGFNGLSGMREYIGSFLELDIAVTEEELDSYAQEFARQKHRFARHPEPAGYEEVLRIYTRSLLK